MSFSFGLFRNYLSRAAVSAVVASSMFGCANSPSDAGNNDTLAKPAVSKSVTKCPLDFTYGIALNERINTEDSGLDAFQKYVAPVFTNELGYVLADDVSNRAKEYMVKDRLTLSVVFGSDLRLVPVIPELTPLAANVLGHTASIEIKLARIDNPNIVHSALYSKRVSMKYPMFGEPKTVHQFIRTEFGKFYKAGSVCTASDRKR